MKEETKDKIIKVLFGIIGILSLIIISILIFKKFENNNSHSNDNEKFHEEYKNVPKDNLFIYVDTKEAIKILENGTGVLYIGFPECKWCQAYVPILNEAAEEANLEKIYYLNILNDRTNNTKDYQKIVKLLEDNLLNDDEGNKRVYVPDVTIINKGKIIGHDNESSVITKEDGTPEEYWTQQKKETLKTKLKNYFYEIEETCTSCNL